MPSSFQQIEIVAECYLDLAQNSILPAKRDKSAIPAMASLAHPMTDFAKLIPELKDWNNGEGIDVGTWIGCAGGFQLAVGYSTLFWPSFVEFEGYVFREGFAVEGLRAWERQGGIDRRSIESVMNHLHIADTHYAGCPDIDRDRIIYLGRTLRDIYTAKLAFEFPERSFTVRFDDSDHDDLIDYQLTFFQNDRNS